MIIDQNKTTCSVWIKNDINITAVLELYGITL